MDSIYHALVLNFHQPSHNLQDLFIEREWEAKEILFAMDRMPRALWEYEDIARVHLSLSGTLLETLSEPDFQAKVYGLMKCGELLWHLQNSDIFHILGTGFYHPVFPLTPEADWYEQLKRWQGIAKHLFWREHFPGFWPPEMGFCMEMIPALKRMGYEYVLVDSNYIEPVEPMRWEELRYRPHIAKYGGEEIVVVVRDRELSDAQESGMDEGWFIYEMHERTKWCDFPPLVTTCTDGDNGGWFRNTSEKGNFWYVFYRPLLERVRRKTTAIQPIFIPEYIKNHGTGGYVNVTKGAWNTGWHHGADFMQWTGSTAQKDALKRIEKTSKTFHVLAENTPHPRQNHELNEAYWHILRAETSCNFYWGEAWIQHCHDDLDIAWLHMSEMQTHLKPGRNNDEKVQQSAPLDDEQDPFPQSGES